MPSQHSSRHNRPITANDNIGKVCGCANCKAAGVEAERMRRVPGPDGKARWIHAEELRDWLKAYRALRAQFSNAINGKGMEKKA